MGSLNYLLFTAPCPCCHATTELVAQVHHVSSYDGDATGRFCERTYRPGERFAWWPSTDTSFGEWRQDRRGRVDPSGLGPNEAEEVCCAECAECGGWPLVLVRMTDLVAQVIAVHGPDGPTGADWGAGYEGGYYL